MDEVRLSIGIARWTADFTPQAETYLPDSYTKLLLRARSGKIVDESPVQAWLTVNGNSAPSADHKVKVKEAVRSVTTEEAGKAIENHINALPELAERQAYVQNVKTAVAQAVSNYLAMSEVEKESFAASLGLAPNELITLLPQDAQRIVLWLDSRSLHFGQSAFLSLESLLDQKGISYVRTDIAQKAILIDVLTGVISPLDDGDLVISVFALNKVAGLYGVSLQGANLSWDDLKAIAPTTATATSPRVIAHINGNHYVIVTAMTADSITYIDPGIGKDKENESVTITKDGFLKAWSAGGGSAFGGNGNVTLETSKLGLVSGWENKTLSASQTQKIRGAFWGSLLNFIGFILQFTPLAPFVWIVNIAAFVASVAEGDWISALSAAVTLGFKSIDLGGFFEGANNFLGPLGQAFQNVYNGVTGFLGNIANGIGGFLEGALGLSSQLAADIARTAVSTGVSFGVSKGLESLGVSPQISGFFGSLAAGAVIGGMREESTVEIFGKTHVVVSQAQHIQSSIQEVITLNQIGSLGLELGLDPVFTNIVGLSLASIQGTQITNPGTSLELAFSQIRPQFVSSIAQYGIQRLGTTLGLDNRITSLVGTPIAGAIGAGLQGGANAGQEIISAINLGIQRGVVSLGLEYLAQQISSNLLLGSLASRAIAGAIEGTLNGGNLFQGIFDALRSSALNVARLGISDNDPFAQIQYLQRVTNFSQIIQQKGLAQAIEESAAQILHEDSVSSILKSFATIKAYVEDAIVRNQLETIQVNGVPHKKLVLPNGDYLIFTSDLNTLVEAKKGGRLLQGTFGKDDQGNWGLITGTVTERDLAGKILHKDFYENGNVVQSQVGFDSTGQNPRYTIKKPSGSQWVVFDREGNLRDADIEGQNNFRVAMRDGLPVSLRQSAIALGAFGNPFTYNDMPLNTPILASLGITAADLQGLYLNLSQDSTTGQTKFELSPADPSNTSILQNLKGKLAVGGALFQESFERLSNAILWYGPSTNQEIATHKNAELQKIAASPSKLFVIHTKTDAPASYIIRQSTAISGDPVSVNHSALAFQGTDGQVYVIDIDTNGAQYNKSKGVSLETDVRVKTLQEWQASYKDVVVQELPLDNARIVATTDRLGIDFVNFSNMHPKISLKYDYQGALVGASTGIPVPGLTPPAQTFCSNLICDIIKRGTGSDIPGLRQDPYVSPNELRRAIEQWIAQTQP